MSHSCHPICTAVPRGTVCRQELSLDGVREERTGTSSLPVWVPARPVRPVRRAVYPPCSAWCSQWRTRAARGCRLCCSWWRAARACRRPWGARSPETLRVERVRMAERPRVCAAGRGGSQPQDPTVHWKAGCSEANAPCPCSPSRTAVRASFGSASLETGLAAGTSPRYCPAPSYSTTATRPFPHCPQSAVQAPLEFLQHSAVGQRCSRQAVQRRSRSFPFCRPSRAQPPSRTREQAS